MRKTLGCLLAGELWVQLRRVSSGNRKAFVEGVPLERFGLGVPCNQEDVHGHTAVRVPG